MKYLKKRRIGLKNSRTPASSTPDPLEGMANMFDLGVVLIVGLLLSLFSVYHLQGLFSETSTMTILKQDEKTHELEIITKEGKKVSIKKVSKEKVQGKGERLGVAYKLNDGSMVYVPE